MPDEYDLKPVEPPPQANFPPAGAAPGMPNAAAPAPGFPPGFVPPAVIIEGPDPDPEEAAEAAAAKAIHDDIETHKGVAILGYIPPRFVVPLMVAPQSKFARYHANQGLLVFISAAAVLLSCIVLQVSWDVLFPIVDRFGLGILYFFASCFVHLGQIVLILLVIALSVMGIIHAANGETKPLPLLGRYILIK